MRSLLLRRLVPLVAASGLLAGAVLSLTAVTASAHRGHHVAHHARGRPGESTEGSMTLYVSPTGASSNSGDSCADAQYSTIQSAVTAAAASNTVIVCSGTYAEDVAVAKALTLEGQDAVINATGQNNGIVISASDVSVSGFTVRGATGEGILAVGTPDPSLVPVGRPQLVGEQDAA